MNILQKRLSKYDAPQKTKEAGIYPYFREIESDQDTEVFIHGKKVLMFGSNAYLGLTNHPRVKEAAIEAIRKYGTGCAGSRFLNGTLDIHVQLEKRLAEFVGKEDAISFSTGFQVNLGVISCITGRKDYIIWDELDHASIMVDEAHAIGVLGEHGSGTCNHFGVTNDVDLIMGTFSKSFAALGELTHYALDGFRQMGCETGDTSTPVIPLFIRDNNLIFNIVRELFEAGIFVNPVVSPAVTSHDTLIRFSLMATHTIEQLDFALEKIRKIFKKHNLI